MKIKIIHIMNRIYQKEIVPKKVMYDFKTYFYDERTQDYTDYDRTCGLFSDILERQYGILSCLDEEVEIVEENKNNKIEKLNIEFASNDDMLYKINELIDKVNNIKEEGK